MKINLFLSCIFIIFLLPTISFGQISHNKITGNEYVENEPVLLKKINGVVTLLDETPLENIQVEVYKIPDTFTLDSFPTCFPFIDETPLLIAKTDSKGKFKINNLKDGNYFFRFVSMNLLYINPLNIVVIKTKNRKISHNVKIEIKEIRHLEIIMPLAH